MSLLVDRRADHALLTLAAPPRNLLDGALLDALLAALGALAADGAPPLLLAAEGKHFSTGYPIDAIPEAIFHADPAVRAGAPFERVMAALWDYPAPVVAAIQGDAWGGALELLCCADLRVAVPAARFAVPALRLGLVYSPTGMRRLQSAFGAPLARELLLTGEPLGARRALRAGFLCRLATPERLAAATAAVMASLLAAAPGALRGTRRSLRLLEAAEPLAPALLTEIAALRHAAWQSEDFREAQQAFLEKRPPRWRND
jgi:methylmalonyl-CoA decarboxylase